MGISDIARSCTNTAQQATTSVLSSIKAVTQSRFIRNTFTILGSSVVTAGRMIVNAGQHTFNIKKAADQWIGDVKHPAVLPITAVAIISNAILNLLTRGPANYRLFRKEETKEDDGITLSTSMKLIYYFGMATGYVSGIMQSVNAYFTAIALLELFMQESQRTDATPEQKEAYQEYIKIAFGLTLFTTNFITFLAWNQKKIRSNLREGLDVMQKRLFTNNDDGQNAQERPSCNKTVVFAALITIGGMLPSPFMAYFGTQSALTRVQLTFDQLGWFHVPNSVIQGCTYMSTFTAPFTQALNLAPSVYKLIQGDETAITHHFKGEALYVFAVYSTGMIDASFSGLQALTGTQATAVDLKPDFNTRQLGFILPAAGSSLCSAILTFAFSAVDAANETKRDYNRRMIEQNDLEQQAVRSSDTSSDSDEDDATITNDQRGYAPLPTSDPLEIPAEENEDDDSIKIIGEAPAPGTLSTSRSSLFSQESSASVRPMPEPKSRTCTIQ